MPASDAFLLGFVYLRSELVAVSDLFTAYADSLGIDLAYQNFAEELASLPGQYAPPHGALLLARLRDGTPIGCVGLRPLSSPGVGEIKRLYVSPSGRGLGVGRALAEAILQQAKTIGYDKVRLDTLPFMTAAIGLYRALGFSPAAAYYTSPIAGTLFMERLL
jgi:ribosomal protein S18 acetylase RimI-like enzyme